MKTILKIAAALILFGNIAWAQAPAKKPDVWEPLRFLVGKWEGDSQGEPGQGRSVREYAFVLNGRFLDVRNQSTYPPQEKNPKGEVHEDRGLVSYDRALKKFVFRQFHVEGFVSHYVLDSISEDGRTIVFVTTAIENIPAGWRGRETWTRVGDDEFTEVFEMAEPGREFAKYSEARFRRAKP